MLTHPIHRKPTATSSLTKLDHYRQNPGFHPVVYRGTLFRVQSNGLPMPLHNISARFKKLSLILVMLVMAGCSLRMTYPFMDWWLSWAVRDYVNLNRDQRQQMEAHLDHFHQWHQREQLPLYSAFVSELATDVQSSIDKQLLEDTTQQIQKHWLASLDQLLPHIDQLFVSLSDEQWQEFLQNLEKKQREYADPFINSSDEKRLKLRQKRFTKGAKRWIGNLSQEQKLQVEAWSHALIPMAEANIEHQQVWSKRASEVFQQRHDMEEGLRRQSLRKLIVNNLEDWTPEAQKNILHNRQLTYQLLIDLHQSLTPKQQRRLQKQLLGYQQDFEYLVAQVQPLIVSEP